MKKLLALDLLVVLVLISLIVPNESIATLTLVTDRTTLAGNDFIDWGALGTPQVVLPNPFTITSNSGNISADVSKPSGIFETLMQAPPGSLFGNFAPGDNLLWTAYAAAPPPGPVYSSGPIDISFDTPVSGVGTQIQRDFYGEFTAYIDIFDISNNLIGSFSEVGDSNGDADNSAIFLGVMSTLADISRIEYGISSAIPTETNLANSFAINRVDLVTAPIPEPATMLLLGCGLIGLAGYGRKKLFRK